MVSIIGPIGSGKTSLCRELCGCDSPKNKKSDDWRTVHSLDRQLIQEYIRAVLTESLISAHMEAIKSDTPIILDRHPIEVVEVFNPKAVADGKLQRSVARAVSHTVYETLAKLTHPNVQHVLVCIHISKSEMLSRIKSRVTCTKTWSTADYIDIWQRYNNLYDNLASIPNHRIIHVEATEDPAKRVFKYLSAMCSL